MKYLKSTCAAAFASALAVCLTGCTHETMLTPAAGTAEVGGATGLTSVGNVQLRANGPIWPGIAKARTDVTPVRFSLYNSGDQPLRIRYDQFWLLDRQGHEYAALPPFEVRRGTAVSTYPATEPAFDSSGFRLAPAYRTIYPDLAVTTHGMGPEGESLYYSTYYPYWATTQAGLPTATMLRFALPEGVVEAGGHVDGYLYFQHVPMSAGKVNLIAQLVNASNGAVLGTATIPFRTE